MSDLELITEQIAQDQQRFRVLVNGDVNDTVELENRTSKSIAGIVDERIDDLIAGIGGDAVTSVNGRTGAVTLTKADVGLNNVENLSPANLPISSATQAALDLKLNSAEKGATDGVCELVSGLVPANRLPSYVDDVLEFANLAAFPTTGETGKIYVALDTNLIYRWAGSVYVNIGGADSGAFVGLIATNNAALTIPNNTLTLVPFQTTIKSNGADIQAGQLTRINLRRTGVWAVSWYVAIAPNVNGSRISNIRLNGTNIVGGQDTKTTNGVSALSVGKYIEIIANDGDYIDITVVQNSGVALATGGANNDNSSRISVQYLGT